jgi:hypothetical protein
MIAGGQCGVLRGKLVGDQVEVPPGLYVIGDAVFIDDAAEPVRLMRGAGPGFSVIIGDRVVRVIIRGE